MTFSLQDSCRYQTRDGRVVQVTDTNDGSTNPFIGTAPGEAGPTTWTKDGWCDHRFDSQPSPLDLVACVEDAPPEPCPPRDDELDTGPDLTELKACAACGEEYQTGDYPVVLTALCDTPALYSTVCKWCISRARRRMPHAEVGTLQDKVIVEAALLPPKTCPSCLKTKPGAAFNAEVRFCRKCHPGRVNHARHAQDRSTARRTNIARARYLAYLSTHPCVDCGQDYPLFLECDHIPSKGQKIDGVGAMVSDGRSWKTIEAEIAKCEVRCLHCHRKRTTCAQGSWMWDALVNGNMPVDHEAEGTHACQSNRMLKEAQEYVEQHGTLAGMPVGYRTAAGYPLHHMICHLRTYQVRGHRVDSKTGKAAAKLPGWLDVPMRAANHRPRRVVAHMG